MAALNLNNPITLQYWGSILAAGMAGEGTTQLWDRIKAQNSNTAQDKLNANFVDVSRLRAAAGAQARAMRTLAATPDHIAIDASHFSVAPYGRDQAERNTLGLYTVDVLHTTLTDEGEQRDIRTVTFRGALPPTVGQLRQTVEQDAQAMADKYGVEHVSAEILNIFAV